MLVANPTLHDKDEVLTAYRQADGRLKERYHAVLLSLHGECCERIAEVLFRSVGSVRGWLTRYNDGGLGALADDPFPGRPPTLTPEELLA